MFALARRVGGGRAGTSPGLGARAELAGTGREAFAIASLGMGRVGGAVPVLRFGVLGLWAARRCRQVGAAACLHHGGTLGWAQPWRWPPPAPLPAAPRTLCAARGGVSGGCALLDTLCSPSVTGASTGTLTSVEGHPRLCHRWRAGGGQGGCPRCHPGLFPPFQPVLSPVGCGERGSAQLPCPGVRAALGLGEGGGEIRVAPGRCTSGLCAHPCSLRSLWSPASTKQLPTVVKGPPRSHAQLGWSLCRRARPSAWSAPPPRKNFHEALPVW